MNRKIGVFKVAILLQQQLRQFRRYLFSTRS